MIHFRRVRVTRSLVLYVCFVDRCLSFCTFSFGHCVVCSSSIYRFWLPPFVIFKLFIHFRGKLNLEQHFGKTPETSKFVLSPKGFPLDQLVISTSWESILIVWCLNSKMLILFVVFNATFNNISVISGRSVVLVEDTGENQRPAASHWQILSHMFYRVHLAWVGFEFTTLGWIPRSIKNNTT